MDKPTGQPPYDPVQHVMMISSGYIPAAAFHVVVSAGIADQLAAGPRTAAELAKATGTNEDALFRLMRLLASVGIFAETGPRTFALTPASDLLRKDNPRSMHDMAVFIGDPFHFNVYAELAHSLKTGKPAGDRAVGMPVFEYFAKNPGYSEVFNRAMTNLSAAVVPATLEAYDFSGIGTLVDVAGGHGELLMSIMKANPKMRGILMDLGHVVEGAKPRVAAAGLADRVQLVAGDFFKEVPAGGDAYIMKHIIHDWDDERATTILKNIHKAISGKNGKVILLEGIVSNEPGFSKTMDIEMMALPGGRERTVDEFKALFAGAGFELANIVPTKSPTNVIEARKR